ncbi:MAG: amidohydrolase family protein [Candidatus Poseidoniaceae archaeon]|nr:amidohydrolase family protein [Candidatus Poseidoniaceae archaeon]
MTPSRRAFFLTSLMLLSLVNIPFDNSAADDSVPDVVISEILVSPSDEDHNGTDWNGDGVIGSSSDQFIELWNRGDIAVNISNWWLDDSLNGGSAQCSIGWNTTLHPDARIVFFRADTGIELDYFDSDTVNLRMPDGTLVDSLSYPAEDSWWDTSYVPNNGTLDKVEPPTPGWIGSDSSGAYTGRCYTPRDHIHQDSYILTGRVVTMQGYSEVMLNGSIMVTDGEIEALWNTGEQPPLGISTEGVPVHHTGATIYPGLIDMHQHLTYNLAPLWDLDVHLSQNNRNEWGGYQNRYQWTDHPDYGPEVSKVKISIHSQPYWNMESQAMKYVEMKEVVGGTTSIQGDGHNYGEDTYDSILARNIEHYNWGKDDIETKILELPTDYSGNHIKNGNSSGDLDAWFLHLAEGVDQSSRDEFDIIEDNGLLVGELVLIHGTGLTSTEFDKMAAVGASLVWSPTSNLLLYGQTTDVAAAKDAGLTITLAPDWSPSGTKSPLHELKTADMWDEKVLGDIFSDYEMVQMVTSNAADSMNWGDKIGRIAPGMAADFAIIDSFDEDPYRNLIAAVDPDVRLVVMGGLPLFGDLDLMQAMKGSDFEIVSIDGIYDKALDVTYTGIEEGTQSWESIVDDLTMAMRFDREEMFAHFGDSFDDRSDFDDMWASGSYGEIDAVPLDPLFTWGDDRYFGILNNSVTANAQGDMAWVYDTFYGITMSADGERDVSLDWQAGSVFNGSEPEDNSTGSNNGGGDGENTTTTNGTNPDEVGIDDSVVEGGTCSPGETKPPDSADCRYCVCQGDSTWRCDSKQCDDQETQSENTKASGMGPASWIAVMIGIGGLILAVIVLSRKKEPGLDPWMEEPEEMEISNIPELPPIDAVPSSTPDKANTET